MSNVTLLIYEYVPALVALLFRRFPDNPMRANWSVRVLDRIIPELHKVTLRAEHPKISSRHNGAELYARFG